MRLDWIRWTMRTGPLVDALIEHPVGDLGLCVPEDGFHVAVAGAFWRELTHGPAAGCGWVTAGRPVRGTRGGGGPLAPGTIVVLRRPRASFRQTNRTTDRARPGTPREG
ncbi:hypothetical protein ACFWXA_29040 [Streptomyces atroolivaceus]|uniref:hypothetical protein n=1 Tax=Streptomyces atroolivaceus TaxID=66869 RepID=UPI003649EBE5